MRDSTNFKRVALAKALAKMIGLRVGRLRVVEAAEMEGGRRVWRCLCDCGAECTVSHSHLVRKSGGTRSCGCLSREVTAERSKRHGASGTKTYAVYTAMRRRCYNPRAMNYRHYGARGVAMCAAWESDFANFLRDMGPTPFGMTIDRIDGHGGYWCGKCSDCSSHDRASNCRWATLTEQARNRSTTVLSATIVLTIRALRDSGMRSRAIAKHLGLNRSTTEEVCADRNWAPETMATAVGSPRSS